MAPRYRHGGESVASVKPGRDRKILMKVPELVLMPCIITSRRCRASCCSRRAVTHGHRGHVAGGAAAANSALNK